MLKPKKRTGANQYTVKRDRAEKAARETADAAEKQSLPSVAELEEKRAALTAELRKVEKQVNDMWIAKCRPIMQADGLTFHEVVIQSRVAHRRSWTSRTATSRRQTRWATLSQVGSVT